MPQPMDVRRGLFDIALQCAPRLSGHARAERGVGDRSLQGALVRYINKKEQVDPMFRRELSQVQAALTRKLEALQREAEVIGQALQALNHEIKHTPAPERVPLITEREELYAKQHVLLAEAKRLQDLATCVLSQETEADLRTYQLVAQNGGTVNGILKPSDEPP